MAKAKAEVKAKEAEESAEEESASKEESKDSKKAEKKTKASKKESKPEGKEESSEEKSASDLEEKKKRIAEKAKKLAETLEKVEEKKAAKAEKDEIKFEGSDDMLVPLEDYVKSGIYLGTKVITTDMRPYVFKRRTDGLAIINTKLVDEKIKTAISFISKYEPERIIAVCKREAGWKALKAFGKATGIKVFTKKYPAGVITNSTLEEFFEPSLVMVTDPWLDKNPIADANQINVPLVAVCDTNNLTSSVDLVVPGNNKSNKSIGLIFWLLARGYIKERGLDNELPELKEFVGE